MTDRKDRIKHIFQFMEYEELSEKRLDLIISFEKQYKNQSSLSEKQYDILEDIFKQAAGKV